VLGGPLKKNDLYAILDAAKALLVGRKILEVVVASRITP
jgi:hypothetical protein